MNRDPNNSYYESPRPSSSIHVPKFTVLFQNKPIKERLVMMGMPTHETFTRAFNRKLPFVFEDLLNVKFTREQELAKRSTAATNAAQELLSQGYFRGIKSSEVHRFAEDIAATFFDAGLYQYLDTQSQHNTHDANQSTPNDCMICNHCYSDFRKSHNIKYSPLHDL